jgi:hypothetical protein
MSIPNARFSEQRAGGSKAACPRRPCPGQEIVCHQENWSRRATSLRTRNVPALHDLAAGRAKHDAARCRTIHTRIIELGVSISNISSRRLTGRPVVCLLANDGQLLPATRTQEAVVAHLHKASGQNLLQKAVDEFLGRQGAEGEFPCVRSTIAKGHLPVGQLEDALVADRHPKDVGSQILQGRPTIANRLAVDNPGLLPGRFWNGGEQRCLAQGVTELAQQFSVWILWYSDGSKGRTARRLDSRSNGQCPKQCDFRRC